MPRKSRGKKASVAEAMRVSPAGSDTDSSSDDAAPAQEGGTPPAAQVEGPAPAESSGTAPSGAGKEDTAASEVAAGPVVEAAPVAEIAGLMQSVQVTDGSAGGEPMAVGDAPVGPAEAAAVVTTESQTTEVPAPEVSRRVTRSRATAAAREQEAEEDTVAQGDLLVDSAELHVRCIVPREELPTVCVPGDQTAKLMEAFASSGLRCPLAHCNFLADCSDLKIVRGGDGAVVPDGLPENLPGQFTQGKIPP